MRRANTELRASALGAPIRSGLLIALIVARFAYPEARSAILDLLAIGILGVLFGLTYHIVAGGPHARRVVRLMIATLVTYRVLVLSYLDDPWLDLALLVFSPCSSAPCSGPRMSIDAVC